MKRTRITIDQAELVDVGDGQGQVELYLRLGTVTWLVVLPAIEVDPDLPPDDIGRPQRVRRELTPVSAGLTP